MSRSVTALAVVLFACSSVMAIDGKWNFPDRKAIVIDICPHIKITSFSFENTIEGRVASSKHSFRYQWKNVSSAVPPENPLPGCERSSRGTLPWSLNRILPR